MPFVPSHTLITPTEAAALLQRPTRGRKVHTSSIIRWGKLNRFPMEWCNGWKVDHDLFLDWARREHRLPGSGKPAYVAAKQRRRQQESSDAIFLSQTIGLKLS